MLFRSLHNIESVLHRRCAEVEPFPLSAMHRRFAANSIQFENVWLPRFELLLVSSEEDTVFTRRFPTRTVVYPNTLPIREIRPSGPANQIIFSGNFAYHPNRDAVRYLAGEIWPKIRKANPSVELVLLGKNPEPVREFAAGDPKVRLTGPVEDALEEIARSRVAIVPLRSGSGTRVKILEAWAAGVPVVSTGIGAEGLGACQGEHLLLADEPDRFASCVSRLLDSDDLRRAIAQRASELFSEKFTWPAGWKVLEQLGI